MFFREGFLGHLCRRLNFNQTYLTSCITLFWRSTLCPELLCLWIRRKPPYTARKQRPPGLESKMVPKADHGQDGYVGNSKLVSKVAIITGGDSGIGRSIAIAFAREGADVVLSYLRAEERDARETASWVSVLCNRRDLRGDRGSNSVLSWRNEY